MSLFEHPWVAKRLSRAMQRGVELGRSRLASETAARFPEYPGQPELITIDTPFGPTELRVFRTEQAGSAVTPASQLPAVYVNFHGGGYVMELTIMDDAVCRILAAESGAVVVNAP